MSGKEQSVIPVAPERSTSIGEAISTHVSEAVPRTMGRKLDAAAPSFTPSVATLSRSGGNSVSTSSATPATQVMHHVIWSGFSCICEAVALQAPGGPR